MRKIFTVLILLALYFGANTKVFGQIVYTSVPCASNSWSDSACWSVSFDSKCVRSNSPIPLFPTLGELNGCDVIVNLDHPRTFTGNMVFGRGFTLNMTASFTVDGNIETAQNGTTNFNILGGVLTAKDLVVKNDFNLTIFAGAEVILDNLDMAGNNTNIIVNEGGKLTVLGMTYMRGTRSDITIAGEFNSGSIDVAGATNNITTSSTASVYVSDPEGGINVSGNATLNITGSSEVIVEGTVEVKGANLNVTQSASLTIYTDFLVNGGSNVNITTQGEVYVCGMRPDPDEITNIDDDAIYDILDDPILCNITIMPVTLSYFESSWNHGARKSNLKWATTIEKGNSHFEIERSLGGTKDFEKIGEVQGMGWKDTLTEYLFEDEEIPLTGGNVYYRLKQIGFEGELTYSKVVSVKVNAIQVSKGVWRAYPNPTTGDQLKLELVKLGEQIEGKIQVRMVSPSAEGLLISGTDMRDISNQLQRKIQTSPKGVYILEVSWGQKIEYLKILKQ